MRALIEHDEFPTLKQVGLGNGTRRHAGAITQVGEQQAMRFDWCTATLVAAELGWGAEAELARRLTSLRCDGPVAHFCNVHRRISGGRLRSAMRRRTAVIIKSRIHTLSLELWSTPRTIGQAKAFVVKPD